MAVESDTTGAHVAVTRAPMESRKATAEGEARSMVIAEVAERLTDQAPGFVACAPGRLDIMGGLAEYMGSLILNMPVAACGCAGAQHTRESRLTVLATGAAAGTEEAGTRFPWSEVQALAGMAPDAAAASVDAAAPGVRCAIGTVVEALRERLLGPEPGGLFIVVGRQLSDGVDIGRDAALIASTLAAVAAASNVQLDVQRAAMVCQRVENHWVGVPVGIGDAVCALAGKANALCEVLGDSGTLQGSIRLPRNVQLIGIDCGTAHPEASRRYQRVRTAAFMGKALIERIIEHDGGQDPHWNGHLAQLPVTQFVDRFRNRLPTKLQGSEYLQRFGETGDPLTRIEEDFSYRVRSRTEHHVYEHERACLLRRHLRQAAQGGNEGDLTEAGKLMYASHWSYGQRCGLGSIETDFLVSVIRKQGLAAHIYGAKITGRGCGGSVAVLMRRSEKAQAAVEFAMRAYAEKTGKQPRLFTDSAPGALLCELHRT